jgi:uncharacterized membrane protein HdeD (DUF308 family)
MNKAVRRQAYVRTDMWREGAWLDLWSVVHFLSGTSIGMGLYFFHFGAAASVVVTLLALICYEMWEAMVQIEETPANRFMDVVVGMASFLPTFFLVSPQLSTIGLYYAFAAVLVVNGVLSVFGWKASQKAAEFEKRVHTQYEHQREKIVKKQRQLRKKLHNIGQQ